MSRGLIIGLISCLIIMTNGDAVLGADVDFATEIRPLLTDHCAACHGGVKKNGGFSVLSRTYILAAGDSEIPIIVPGHAEESLLFQRIAAADVDERMPPADHDALSQQQIQLIRRWIDEGAEWPAHWAWEPIIDVDERFGSHAIDSYVEDALRQSGLERSSPADRRTLIRRLSLDLTGLLPSPEEVAEFVADDSPDAAIALTDRLLNSPHFGERWGRHWLDEARYADSEGYEKDSVKEDAWRYRDWVIRAINDDLPFDEFTIRQIAGDLLPEPTPDDLTATKFHLQTQFNLEGGVDAEEDRTKRVIDQINTVGTVWLGTSIGCCQCHDHPYDPLTQEDFYRFYAFFNNTDIGVLLPEDVETDREKKISERNRKWKKLSELLSRQLHNKNLSNSVQAQLTQLRRFDNEQGFVRYLAERKSDRRDTYVFHRGDFLQPDTESGRLTPATPLVLPPCKAEAATATRHDLAQWLVSDANPLVARVTVNKIWMHLFGQPLADQPQDFGSRGSTSSHPELLDGLASWFMNEGQWSRKELIRLIVRSKTYQQSSTYRDQAASIDPDNRLLWRQNRFRIEAEIVRDIALQTSGLLSRRMGGPSVFPPLPALIAKQTYANSFRYQPSVGEDRYRRGIYTFFRRTAIDPNLLTFDCPDSSMTRSQRDRSNNPLQALALLHNEVFHESAQHFARRIVSLSDSSDQQRLDFAFETALSRPPDATESAILLSLLQQSRGYYETHAEESVALNGEHLISDVTAAEQAAWTATLRALLNLDEFVTRS